MSLYRNPIPPHKKERKSKAPLPTPTLAEINSLRKDLSDLITRIGPNITFELSGGIVIPLTMEYKRDEIKEDLDYSPQNHGFYRHHSAFHISLHTSQLIKMQEQLAQQTQKLQYRLVHHWVSVHGWKIMSDQKVDGYQEIDAKKAIEEKKESLRFVRIKEDKKLATPHINRLDYFDVYPYEYRNSKGEILKPWHRSSNGERLGYIPDTTRVFSENEIYVHSWDKKQRSMSLDNYIGPQITLGQNYLQLTSLNWIKLIKETRPRQDNVDKLDIKLIDQVHEAMQKHNEMILNKKRSLISHL